MTPGFRTLTPTAADIEMLVQINPLAGEQLKVIVLNRMLDEAEARLAGQQRQPVPIAEGAHIE